VNSIIRIPKTRDQYYYFGIITSSLLSTSQKITCTVLYILLKLLEFQFLFSFHLINYSIFSS